MKHKIDIAYLKFYISACVFTSNLFWVRLRKERDIFSLCILKNIMLCKITFYFCVILKLYIFASKMFSEKIITVLKVKICLKDNLLTSL